MKNKIFGVRISKLLRFLPMLAVVLVYACADRPTYKIAADYKDYYTKGMGYNAHYKVGNPYQIQGDTFYPKVDKNYDQRGVASWYGDEFQGKLTANGEVFNMYEYTAAHRTLPLPSMVEVTNLVNGKKVIVRVNDRGPFVNHGERIIDLSYQAAVALDSVNAGLTNVRVRYLKKETEMLHIHLFGEIK